MSISIDGIEKLNQILSGLNGDERVKRALSISGEIVRSSAVMNCPVDTGCSLPRKPSQNVINRNRA
jgi:hypothetical protein|nr:MAG TPA: hypothetical protein [Caudoviricetes sp.]